jgi:hypothetical protein
MGSSRAVTGQHKNGTEINLRLFLNKVEDELEGTTYIGFLSVEKDQIKSDGNRNEKLSQDLSGLQDQLKKLEKDSVNNTKRVVDYLESWAKKYRISKLESKKLLETVGKIMGNTDINPEN